MAKLFSISDRKDKRFLERPSEKARRSKKAHRQILVQGLNKTAGLYILYDILIYEN
jgi:ribosomal protein S21